MANLFPCSAPRCSQHWYRYDRLMPLTKLASYCGVDTGIDEKNLDRIFDEFTSSFKEEFDYRLEAENMKQIAKNMSRVPRFKDEIRIPRPIENKTTKKVLTMTRLRGEPIKKRMDRMIKLRLMERYAIPFPRRHYC